MSAVNSMSNFKIAERKRTLSRHEMDNFILSLGVTCVNHRSKLLQNAQNESGRNTVLIGFSSDLRFASQSHPQILRRRNVGLFSG